MVWCGLILVALFGHKIALSQVREFLPREQVEGERSAPSRTLVPRFCFFGSAKLPLSLDTTSESVTTVGILVSYYIMEGVIYSRPRAGARETGLEKPRVVTWVSWCPYWVVLGNIRKNHLLLGSDFYFETNPLRNQNCFG